MWTQSFRSEFVDMLFLKNYYFIDMLAHNTFPHNNLKKEIFPLQNAEKQHYYANRGVTHNEIAC
jgi:hypothetical protein